MEVSTDGWMRTVVVISGVGEKKKKKIVLTRWWWLMSIDAQGQGDGQHGSPVRQCLSFLLTRGIDDR